LGEFTGLLGPGLPKQLGGEQRGGTVGGDVVFQGLSRNKRDDRKGRGEAGRREGATHTPRGGGRLGFGRGTKTGGHKAILGPSGMGPFGWEGHGTPYNGNPIRLAVVGVAPSGVGSHLHRVWCWCPGRGGDPPQWRTEKKLAIPGGEGGGRGDKNRGSVGQGGEGVGPGRRGQGAGLANGSKKKRGVVGTRAAPGQNLAWKKQRGGGGGGRVHGGRGGGRELLAAGPGPGKATGVRPFGAGTRMGRTPPFGTDPRGGQGSTKQTGRGPCWQGAWGNEREKGHLFSLKPTGPASFHWPPRDWSVPSLMVACEGGSEGGGGVFGVFFFGGRTRGGRRWPELMFYGDPLPGWGGTVVFSSGPVWLGGGASAPLNRAEGGAGRGRGRRGGGGGASSAPLFFPSASFDRQKGGAPSSCNLRRGDVDLRDPVVFIFLCIYASRRRGGWKAGRLRKKPGGFRPRPAPKTAIPGSGLPVWPGGFCTRGRPDLGLLAWGPKKTATRILFLGPRGAFFRAALGGRRKVGLLPGTSGGPGAVALCDHRARGAGAGLGGAGKEQNAKLGGRPGGGGGALVGQSATGPFWPRKKIFAGAGGQACSARRCGQKREKQPARGPLARSGGTTKRRRKYEPGRGGGPPPPAGARGGGGPTRPGGRTHWEGGWEFRPTRTATPHGYPGRPTRVIPEHSLVVLGWGPGGRGPKPLFHGARERRRLPAYRQGGPSAPGGGGGNPMFFSGRPRKLLRWGGFFLVVCGRRGRGGEHATGPTAGPPGHTGGLWLGTGPSAPPPPRRGGGGPGGARPTLPANWRPPSPVHRTGDQLGVVAKNGGAGSEGPATTPPTKPGRTAPEKKKAPPRCNQKRGGTIRRMWGQCVAQVKKVFGPKGEKGGWGMWGNWSFPAVIWGAGRPPLGAGGSGFTLGKGRPHTAPRRPPSPPTPPGAGPWVFGPGGGAERPTGGKLG